LSPFLSCGFFFRARHHSMVIRNRLCTLTGVKSWLCHSLAGSSELNSHCSSFINGDLIITISGLL
jgi:hypothetical protein